jgi:hypothetical protein
LRAIVVLLLLGFDLTRLGQERAEKQTVHGWRGGGVSPGLQGTQ